MKRSINTSVIALGALLLLLSVFGCDKRENPTNPAVDQTGLVFQGQHQYDGLEEGQQAPDWIDFASRVIKVYAPPGYEPDMVGPRFPTLYLLPGYDGEPSFTYQFGNENYFPVSAVAAVADRLIAEGEIKPMFICMPDASTFYGGTFFANSRLLGQWEEMMAEELVNYMDAEELGSGFRTLAQKESRAISGHVSGGYGAVRIAMKYPDVFNSVSSIDGALSLGNGNMTEVFNQFIAEQGITSEEDYFDTDTLNIRNEPYKMLIFTMAGTFSPAEDVSIPANGAEPLERMRIQLPFDYQGALVQDVWQMWLDNDLYTWLDEQAYQTALSGQNLYFEYSDHNMFGFHTQTQEFLGRLDQLGIDYQSASFSSYEGADPRSRTFLNDRLEEILKFHDQYLMDRNGNF